MKENSTDWVFNESFFDTGKKEPGLYGSYRLEDLYPQFSILAMWIKNYFSPARVLDIGCAKGFLVKALKDAGIEAWGVDASQYAISNGPEDVRSNLFKVDLNKDVLPFKDEYFDFVTFLGTVEYLRDHNLALRECKRVLRHGGILFLTTIYKRYPGDKIRVNIHDKDYWVKQFRSYGFKVVPKTLDSFLKERLTQILSSNHKSTKLRLGKLLYWRGGCLGKWIVFRWSKFSSRYGILLFLKED